MLRILNELSRIDQSAVNIVVNTGFPVAEAETPRIGVQGREPPPKLEITTVDFVESLWKSVSTENVFGPSGRKVSKTRFYRINYKIRELSKKNTLLFRFRGLCKPCATNTINTVNPKLVAVRLEVQVT